VAAALSLKVMSYSMPAARGAMSAAPPAESALFEEKVVLRASVI